MANAKIVDSDVCRTLVSAMVVEQLSWKELPQRYEQLTGETPDLRTLRRYVVDEIGAVILLDRVSNRLRDQVIRAFNAANVVSPAIYALAGTYQEWSELYERDLYSLAVSEANQEDPDIIVRLPKPLLPKELKRMDQLWEELISIFTGINALKQAQTLNDLLQAAFGAVGWPLRRRT